MKQTFTFLFILFSFFGFSQKTQIEMNATDVALIEVIQHLEKNHSYLFSYKESDILNLTVRPPSGKNDIEYFLNFILKDKNLRFEIVQQNYIIFSQKETPNSEIESLTYFLCGKIIDSNTQLPLEFANVFLQKKETGTTSQTDGSFQIKTNFQKNDTLIISYVGYQEKRFSAKDFLQQPCKKIALDYFEFRNLIVVADYLTDGISLNNNGAYTELQPERIGALPGQVEPDILKTIQFLPGITSTDGSSSSINIRGGTPDQNLILWEDIPIYHSAHYFGMISAFNPYIIKKAKIYRGGFDADFGGRISGVIDMKSDDFSLEKNKFDAGINFINAFANGKVSLLEKKASVIFSVRRSIADWWNSPTFENINRRIHQGILFDAGLNNKLPPGVTINDSFSYFDSNLKISFQASDRDEISIAGLFANNNFISELRQNTLKQTQLDTLFLNTYGMSLSWKHQWNSNFSTKILALFSDYRYDYNYNVQSFNQNVADKVGQKMSAINEQQFHLINNYQTKTQHSLKLGYQVSIYDVGFQITKKIQGNPQAHKTTDYHSNLHVLYSSWNTPKTKPWGLNAGLRLNYLESEKSTFLEPRLRFWYQPSKNWNFYFNTGKYHQFLSQLIEIKGDNSSIETPVWVLTGQKEVPILSATQHQFGTVFQKDNWLIDLQFYLKNIEGLTSLATGFSDAITDKFHLGFAKIRGLDLLIKKRWKNYRTWISYSFSQIDYEFPTFFDAYFSPPNHLPHSFHWVNMWHFKSFEFSLGWKIISGSPYSLKDNFVIQVNPPGMGPRESIIPIVNEFNDQRLAPQHQLDASINYNFFPKKSKDWTGSIGLSLLNIYDQTNIYNKSFFMDIRPNELPSLKYTNKADLRFTPNLMVKFEW